MTAQVFRHISGPGSGKTHTLLTFVSQEQEQEQGLALRDLTFCSFTRSQRDDIRVRIGALFPDATAKEIRKQVKTVHGVALTDCLRHGLIPNFPGRIRPSSPKERTRNHLSGSAGSMDWIIPARGANPNPMKNPALWIKCPQETPSLLFPGISGSSMYGGRRTGRLPWMLWV